jgi:hypothetical protein
MFLLVMFGKSLPHNVPKAEAASSPERLFLISPIRSWGGTRSEAVPQNHKLHQILLPLPLPSLFPFPLLEPIIQILILVTQR